MLAWLVWSRFTSFALRPYFLCSTSQCSLQAELGETGKRSRYGDSLRAGRFDVRTQVGARDLPFSALFQISSGAQIASHLMGTKVLPWVYIGRVVALTTLFHLASRLQMGGAIPVLPLSVFMGCDGVTFPSIHIWRYSPFRALASLKARLHSSLFSALLLHPLIPSSCCASLWTTSAHLVLGLPRGDLYHY